MREVASNGNRYALAATSAQARAAKQLVVNKKKKVKWSSNQIEDSFQRRLTLTSIQPYNHRNQTLRFLTSWRRERVKWNYELKLNEVDEIVQ